MLPTPADGSLLLVFAALLGAGMGLPISEDAVILATGAFADRGIFPTYAAVATCFAGVLAGDFCIYAFGRYFGRRAFEWKFFRKLLTDERRDRAEALYARHGGKAVFFFRFLIGFRLPGFATAGLLNVPPWRFLFFDALAASITVPTVFFVGFYFSDRLEDIKDDLAAAEVYVLIAVVVVAALALLAWRRKKKAEELLDYKSAETGHDTGQEEE